MLAQRLMDPVFNGLAVREDDVDRNGKTIHDGYFAVGIGYVLNALLLLQSATMWRLEHA